MMLSTTPKISVIVPIFGVEKYIERCATSLFEQTLQNIEYIFVNDCTKDSSIDILLNVIKKYPHRQRGIRVINHDQNMGLPTARMTGIYAAKGDYIIHCDSDDWVSADLYEKLYKSIVETNSDVAICDIISTDGERNNGRLKGTITLDYNTFLHNTIKMRTSWSLVNKMFRRSVYSDDIIYPTAYMGEDMGLCLQLLGRCNKLCYVEDSYYYYFRNLQSDSRKEDKENISRLYKDFSKNYNIVLNSYIKRHLLEEYSGDLIYMCFLIKLTFAKRAKSVAFLKREGDSLPPTPISLFCEATFSMLQRFQVLFFYLLKL